MTGMSGTGKSTALVQLARQGFDVIETDVGGWSEWSEHDGGYVWREDRIRDLLAREHGPTIYVSGTLSESGPLLPSVRCRRLAQRACRCAACAGQRHLPRTPTRSRPHPVSKAESTPIGRGEDSSAMTIRCVVACSRTSSAACTSERPGVTVTTGDAAIAPQAYDLRSPLPGRDPRSRPTAAACRRRRGASDVRRHGSRAGCRGHQSSAWPALGEMPVNAPAFVTSSVAAGNPQ